MILPCRYLSVEPYIPPLLSILASVWGKLILYRITPNLMFLKMTCKMVGLQNFKTLAILTAFLLAAAGCATPVPSDPALATIDSSQLPVPDTSIKIPGLSPCTTARDATIHLNANNPVNIIVHGCYSSAARFRALAQVFAFHGQQTICFNYNDRDSLKKSSTQLVDALRLLSNSLNNRNITIIGHSQGGLLARHALSQQYENLIPRTNTQVRLVTISSPFSGIEAADHCASPTARALSLGLVIPICRLISGDKWFEITRASGFIKQPGHLLDQVTSHIKIVTDERGSCRQYDEAGNCTEDDYVFSLKEQYHAGVDKPSQVKNIEVTAGHAEIVGDHLTPPEKLIALLQKNGVMRPTSPLRQQLLSRLLTQLYLIE